MQAKIVDDFTQKNYDKIASPLELDLQEYFKVLQNEIMLLVSKTDGMTVDEFNKQLDELLGIAV